MDREHSTLRIHAARPAHAQGGSAPVERLRPDCACIPPQPCPVISLEVTSPQTPAKINLQASFSEPSPFTASVESVIIHGPAPCLDPSGDGAVKSCFCEVSRASRARQFTPCRTVLGQQVATIHAAYPVHHLCHALSQYTSDYMRCGDRSNVPARRGGDGAERRRRLGEGGRQVKKDKL